MLYGIGQKSGNQRYSRLSFAKNLGRVRVTKFDTNVLIDFYWMLQNARVTAFTVSKILRENQQEDKLTLAPPRLTSNLSHQFLKNIIC